MDAVAQPLSAPAVAALLNEIGTRLDLSGESPFKTRAYFVAAENICAHPIPLEVVIAQGKLKTIPGVGEALAEKIIKLHKTGMHPTLEYLRTLFPPGVLDLLKIPGLGPKKAAALYNTLRITNLSELQDACLAGKLAEEKGFGAKLQAKIIENIAFIKDREGLVLMDAAHDRARTAGAALKARYPTIKEVLAAGDVRRGCEVCGRPELVAVVSEGAGETVLEGTAACRVISTTEAHLGAALLFATGSESHVESLRATASAKGFELTASGLRRGAVECPSATEAEIYSALGLHFIEPELREGRGEIEQAQRGSTRRLVQYKDLRGILHCHTNFSDGSNTLSEMAEAARGLGMEYFGVCDHSQSAAYAGGMRIEKVIAQHALANTLNEGYREKRFRIFKGIESDILEHGELDYPGDQLETFDFIVASVHSRFQLNKKDQTARIVNAVRNPRTTILGHPTGRLLLRREPYAVDLEEVLKECAEQGVAVEINADPRRLDLDWRWHARALELGCLFSINPDAHDTAGLASQKWGVTIARKGGLPPERILNCFDLAAIGTHFEARKKAAGQPRRM